MFYSAGGHLEKTIVTLYADVTIGGTGAPTLVAANSKGIKSIVRNSAGNYTITLQDQYTRMYSFWVEFIKATAPTSPAMGIVAVNTKAAGGGTINFVNYSATTPTDPASGEEMLCEINLSNSSAP